MLGFLSQFPWRAVHAIIRRHTVYCRGVSFTLKCNSRVTHYRWKTYNRKEPDTLDWIDHFRNGDTFFDIGANIGVYALYAALRHPGIRVIAFEPEYANLHMLRDNIVDNGLQDRIEVYSIALSNFSGVSRLHLQDFATGSALHTESKEILQMTLTHCPVLWHEGIAAFTLDSFCDETSLRPDCIKIDVDGTEPKVLEGAVRTLSSPKLRTVIIEPPDEKEARDRCEEMMLTAGLRCERRRDPLTRNDIWVRDIAR